MQIGNVKLENQLILAPLSAVNCIAFRIQCRMHGAAMVTSAMIDCDGLVSCEDERRNYLLHYAKEERPVAGQLVGVDKAHMVEAAKILEPHVDIIDINLGCPDNDVVGKKAGSFLTKHPEQIKKFLPAVVEAVKKPVTAKIRIGWDENNITALQTAELLESYGVKAITIHGRTRKQFFEGKADWDIIRKVKDKANIPIIANGDVFNPKQAKAIMERTQCEAIMIGRASMGNPRIFEQINHYLETGIEEEIDPREKVKDFLEFLELYKKHEIKQKFPEIKHHALWYIKGIGGCKKIKNEIVRCENEEQLLKIINDF